MQKAPEFVVRERVAQGEKVTGAKVNKKVNPWSIEEMQDQANSHVEEDRKEMRTWRGLTQEEVDQCWKELAEKDKVVDSKREALRWNGGVYEEAGSTEHESGKKISGQESSLGSVSTICSEGKACKKTQRKRKK